jgi:hypothetical protein
LAARARRPPPARPFPHGRRADDRAAGGADGRPSGRGSGRHHGPRAGRAGSPIAPLRREANLALLAPFPRSRRSR